MPGTSNRDDRPSVRRLVVPAVLVLAFLLWWLWPVVARHDRRLDVLAADDPLLAQAARPLATYVRDMGKSFRSAPDGAGTCDPAALGAEVARRDPETVVLAAGGDACPVASLVETFARQGRTVVVVLEPGASPALAPAPARVVDAGLIVGVDGRRTERPCEWWDEVRGEVCGDGGFVVVRGDAGEVTARGLDRIGRSVAALLS